MNAIPSPDHDSSSYEPVFSYGHLRGHFLHSDMSSGRLLIDQFVRPEHIASVREHLLADCEILSHTPNTRLQQSLSPVSRQCLWELQSGIMLRVLENITGLFNLLPDTHCKQSRLLLAGENIAVMNWRDEDTGLTAALVLALHLDTGNASIYTRPDTLATAVTGNPCLQTTYWQHTVDTAGAQP